MTRTPEVTHKIMSAIKGHDTAPELMLRRAIWKTGLRYRENDRRVYGKPDMTFSNVKLAVFCEGDYWDGTAGRCEVTKIMKMNSHVINRFRRRKTGGLLSAIETWMEHSFLKDGKCYASGRATYELMYTNMHKQHLQSTTN